MKIVEIENNSLLANSSLLRGEQVFTSLLFWEGTFVFLDDHLDRLLEGAAFLFPMFNWQNNKQELKDYLIEKVNFFDKENYYCRLTIVDDIFFFIAREHQETEINITLAKAVQIKTPSLRPSFLKLSQYADSFLELKNAHESQIDDVIYFDQHNFLTEATTSNVYIVNNEGDIQTPHLSSMVLSGILRAQLSYSFKIFEKNITENDLLDAQEIWLSNSIRGLRFVKYYAGKNYSRHNSKFDVVLKKFGRFGEKIHG